MTGEDTGLGALASPLAGYLGKVQERAASLQYCPWCTSKGLTYALRSYRINLQESITLCTNPQCLFPLVSQSLEDVLASLDPVEPTVGNKRKNPLPLEKEESIKHSPKRLRSSEPDGLGIQSVTDTLISQEEHCAVNAISNGPDAAPLADGKKVNGYHRDINCPVAEITGWESLQDEEDEPDSSAGTEGSAPSTCSASAGPLQSSSEALLTTDGDSGAFSISGANRDFRQVKSHPEVLSRRCNLASNQSVCTNEDIYSNEINTPSPQLIEQTAMTKQKSLTADITTSKDIESIKLETQDLSFTSLTESEELVSVPSQLFWRNTDNLCWLDSLLVALVNCKSLRKCKPRDESQQSSVWQLIRGYEDICAAIQVHQQTDKDGVMKVPNHVLQKASADLQSLRMSVFKLLQPKLHCILGQRETPVFAMPLLLAMDSWVEPLFQSTFHWEFKCSECKAATTERIMKTLPTFTNIVPDWRPLHAVHSSPCNVCHKKNQRRTMMLESVPPVFVLHFVEGLPDNDVRIYTFNFKGKRYSVTMVIQYNHQLKHFVTWICNSDGSWQEYDDLKHPDCKTHQKLPVPAQEMHIIFWEVEEDKEPCVCSPSNSAPDELLACSPDQSLLVPHNDTDIVCALSVSKDSNIMDTTDTAGLDASIGSTTLLDTFEGLNHNDIITLTLVELNNDSEIPTLPPTLDQNARWSFLLSKHPLNLVHKSVAKLAPTHAPTSVTQVNPTPPTHSTPNPVRKQQIPGGLFPKPQLRTEESEGLPLKAAEMYGAFSAKSSNALNPLPSATPLNGKSKLGLPEISSSKKQSSHSSKLYKLMKKLKAKKKKLDKLNELLGVQGGASLRPDSTDLGSPNAVTSSTYDSSTCDDFLSDLLSPATTASNLSPDSTGFLEMVVNGQDGLNQLECGSNAIGAVCQTNISMNRGDTENFMDEFLSQAVAQRPTEMESEAFSALELFF
uniref:Ubiquitin specific peptidase like 1 n=1 Tax=Lates calcarifer TaxID=8187 RepID=A0A4W6FM45_LATCA